VKRAASAVALSTLAESTALADLPPPIDQIGFLTHDKIPSAVRQIAFGVVVALLFVIGGLVEIVGMLP
jgi:hypothetical protein